MDALAPHETCRRSAAAPLTLAALTLVVLAAASRARAGCNAIAPIPEPFEAATGAVDRPFAMPGDEVRLTLAGPCGDALPGFCTDADCPTDPEDRVVVTLVFKPPQGPRTVEVLA